MTVNGLLKMMSVIGVCAIALNLAFDAAAKEPRVTQTMDLYGKVLTFPPPAWVKNSADVLKVSAFNRKQNKNTFLFEMVPKADGFKNWRSLYAVIAANGVMTPKQMQSQIIGIFKGACSAKNLKIERVVAPRKDLMNVIYCGAYKKNPTGGQIGIFYFAGSGNVTARVYHEWRGKNFALEEPGKWPVGKAVLSETVSSMRDNYQAGQMNRDTEELADRIRSIIGDDPNVSERKMFGGVCFMLNGNMLCGPDKSGDLMLRVGKDLEAEARCKPHTREMDFTGKPLKGFVYVEPDGFLTDRQLAEWIAFATNFVGSLPAK